MCQRILWNTVYHSIIRNIVVFHNIILNTFLYIIGMEYCILWSIEFKHFWGTLYFIVLYEELNPKVL